MLAELGNTKAAIPYYGLFQPKEKPIHFDGVFLTSNSFLKQLGADQLNQPGSEINTVAGTEKPLDDSNQPKTIGLIDEDVETISELPSPVN